MITASPLGAYRTKRGCECADDAEDYCCDDQLSDREEGESLSDEEETEIQVPTAASRFFHTDDYQYLVSKTISALDLQTSEEEEVNPKGSKQKPIGKVEFFPSLSPREQVFPFPAFFEKQLKAEWARSLANRRVPTFLKKIVFPFFLHKGVFAGPSGGRPCSSFAICWVISRRWAWKP